MGSRNSTPSNRPSVRTTLEPIAKERMERIARGELQYIPPCYEGVLDQKKARELLRKSPEADTFIPFKPRR